MHGDILPRYDKWDDHGRERQYSEMRVLDDARRGRFFNRSICGEGLEVAVEEYGSDDEHEDVEMALCETDDGRTTSEGAEC